MNFEAIIGLEIHIELKTNRKMFSYAPVDNNGKPNSSVSYLDVAFPGSMPLVNKQAVVHAIRIAHALHMDIDHELWFDRKNYFYSDNPKGYQLTQFFRPLGKNGYLILDDKKINIMELHLEEDTCKQVHLNDKTLLDYNRSGIPLLEIVSATDIRDGKEASLFVEKIHSIVTSLEASDGEMEKGSLRVDVNISLRPYGANTFSNKVEIKNLNSFKNIKLAIDHEIKRQEALLLSGKEVKKETRRFDEKEKKTIYMREKGESASYGYFVDSNIVPIKLSDPFVKKVIDSAPELYEEKQNRYVSLGLNENDTKVLLSNSDISKYFDQTISFGVSPKLVANWLNVDVQSILKKKKIDMKSFPITPNNFAELIKNIENKVISNNQARDIFDRMLIGNENPNSILQELGASLISDEKQLSLYIEEVLKDNPKCVSDYQKGKDKVVGYVSGLVMKKTKGRANPELMNKLVISKLKGQ